MTVEQATRIVDSLTVAASLTGAVVGLLTGNAAVVIWAAIAAIGHARLAVRKP